MEFWNTFTGDVFRTEKKRSIDKRVWITLPEISNDIALKVISKD